MRECLSHWEVFAESDEDGSGTLNKASAGDFKTWYDSAISCNLWLWTCTNCCWCGWALQNCTTLLLKSLEVRRSSTTFLTSPSPRIRMHCAWQHSRSDPIHHSLHPSSFHHMKKKYIRWISDESNPIYIIYISFYIFLSILSPPRSEGHRNRQGRLSRKRWSLLAFSRGTKSCLVHLRFWRFIWIFWNILKVFQLSNHPSIQATDLEDLFSLIDEAPFESVWSFPLRLFQQSFCAAPFLPVTAFRRFDLETCLKCCRDMQDTVSSDWIWSWCINSVVMIWAGAFLFYSCSVLNTVSLRSLNV